MPRLDAQEEAHVRRLLQGGMPVAAWRRLDGTLAARALAPRKAPYSIGRAETADVSIPRAEVSSAHALLRVVSPADVYALDDDSLNGTFLGGALLRHRQRVTDGALLRLSRREIHVLIRLPAEGRRTVPVAAAVSLDDLTPRQLEVLWWLAEPTLVRGRPEPASRDDLCAGLGIGASALGEHLTAIAERLDVAGGEGLRLRLVQRAIHLGIADHEPRYRS